MWKAGRCAGTPAVWNCAASDKVALLVVVSELRGSLILISVLKEKQLQNVTFEKQMANSFQLFLPY